jgi:hypothetical protein
MTWTRWIKFTHSRLALRLPNYLCPWGFPIKILYVRSFCLPDCWLEVSTYLKRLATDYLSTYFLAFWFFCVFKQMLRRFPSSMFLLHDFRAALMISVRQNYYSCSEDYQTLPFGINQWSKIPRHLFQASVFRDYKAFLSCCTYHKGWRTKSGNIRTKWPLFPQYKMFVTSPMTWPFVYSYIFVGVLVLFVFFFLSLQLGKFVVSFFANFNPKARHFAWS